MNTAESPERDSRMFDFELNLFYQSKKVERAGDSKQFQKHAVPQVFLNLF